MAVESPRSSRPWYRRFRDEFILASRWMAVSGSKRTNEISRETIRAFEQELLTRFIFESNNIEREGPSFGETKELILSELADNPDLAELSDWTAQVREDLDAYIKDLSLKAIDTQPAKRTESRSIKLIASYGKKTKDARLVHQQLIAAIDSVVSSLVHSSNNSLMGVMWVLKQSLLFDLGAERQERIRGLIAKILYPLKAEPIPLLTEDLIKSLHHSMAVGLIPKKHAQAGEYRLHPVMVDLQTHFPAPSDVPRAMENFILRYQEMERAEAHPIVLASWAATQFVRIHPFSDFNGRMSRLILNMVLRSYGFSFWLALKSNKKDRARYFYALRRSKLDSGKAMATLVSMQINETFAQFNQQLEMIGDRPLDPQAELPELDELEDAQLLDWRWPILSVLSARDTYIAACREAGVEPEPVDDSPDADDRLKLPLSAQDQKATST